MVSSDVASARSIKRVKAVIYARASTPWEGEEAVRLCEEWAKRHDWGIAAVVRESSPSDVVLPLERQGVQTALKLLDDGRAVVVLIATRGELAEETAAFDAVRRRVEDSGGFLHVVSTTEAHHDS